MLKTVCLGWDSVLPGTFYPTTPLTRPTSGPWTSIMDNSQIVGFQTLRVSRLHLNQNQLIRSPRWYTVQGRSPSQTKTSGLTPVINSNTRNLIVLRPTRQTSTLLDYPWFVFFDSFSPRSERLLSRLFSIRPHLRTSGYVPRSEWPPYS